MERAVLMGVAGVAVTQPVLDLFGRNPTFFVAGGYGRRQIVAFAVVVGFVPTLVAFMVSAVPGLVHRRLGTCLHGAAVAGFAGLFWLVVCRTVGVDALAPAVVLAIVVGVGVALAEWRVRSARLFLSYLAIGNVAFVVLFLLTSPSAKLLQGSLVCGCWKRAGPTVGWPGRRGGSGRVSVDVVATGGRLDKRGALPPIRGAGPGVDLVPQRSEANRNTHPCLCPPFSPGSWATRTTFRFFVIIGTCSRCSVPGTR